MSEIKYLNILMEITLDMSSSKVHPGLCMYYVVTCVKRAIM